jgi:hypothetical protein
VKPKDPTSLWFTNRLPGEHKASVVCTIGRVVLVNASNGFHIAILDGDDTPVRKRRPHAEALPEETAEGVSGER